MTPEEKEKKAVLAKKQTETMVRILTDLQPVFDDMDHKAAWELQLVHDLMKSLCPLMRNMLCKDGWEFLNVLNKLVAETPFHFMIYGDGPGVGLDATAKAFGEAMFNKPMPGYKP